MRKKKKYNLDNINDIQNKIIDKPDLIVPNNYNIDDLNIHESNSWFRINHYNLLNLRNPSLAKNLKFIIKNKIDINNQDTLDSSEFKTNSIQIFPNIEQKLILDKWIESYRLMMNETINLFKTRLYNKDALNPNFRNIRTGHLYDIKKEIQKKSKINNCIIYSHTLDYAIKDICTNVKSALTNYKNKNIKKFRIRYIKKKKPIQLIKFEKTGFKIKEGKLYSNVMGFIESEFLNYDIDCDFVIMKKYNRYYLQLPVQTTITKNNIHKIIALDGGIRTFLTGYNPESVIEICDNYKEKVIDKFKKLDKLNSEMLINNRRKRMAIGKRHFKIKNIVKELQWKTVNYLTENYDKIIMGDISTQSILKNRKIDKMSKRYISSLNFYKFKQKLKYKCSIKNKQLKFLDESYTSKMCSSCGNLNNGQNKSKIFNCQSCGVILDRDNNGAKNIFILGTNIIRR